MSQIEKAKQCEVVTIKKHKSSKWFSFLVSNLMLISLGCQRQETKVAETGLAAALPPAESSSDSPADSAHLPGSPNGEQISKEFQPPPTAAGHVGVLRYQELFSGGPRVQKGGNDPLFRKPGWDYSPAAMYDNGRYRIWWCGEKDGRDHILHTQSDAPGGPYSSAASAPSIYDVSLAPSGDKSLGDSDHACDPSVIKLNGVYYLYLGGLNHNGNAGIFVASSNDGIRFSKLNGGHPIRPTVVPTNGGYGIGQPNVIYHDGWIYLAYTNTEARGGSGIYLMRSRDVLFPNNSNTEIFTPQGFRSYSPDLMDLYPFENEANVQLLYVDFLGRFAVLKPGSAEIGLFTLDILDSQFRVDFTHRIPGIRTEGVETFRTPLGHAITVGSTLKLDIIRSVGERYVIGDGENERVQKALTYDLAYIGFDLDFVPKANSETIQNQGGNQYFTEGSNGYGRDLAFDSWYLISNNFPNYTKAKIYISNEQGFTISKVMYIAPHSRANFHLEDFIGENVSVVIQSLTPGQPLQAQRSIYWKKSRWDYIVPDSTFATGAMAAAAVSGPHREWYFAEGSTNNFEHDPGQPSYFLNYFTVSNPNPISNRIRFEFMDQSGRVTVTPDILVPAQGRTSFNPESLLGSEKSFGTRIEGLEAPIVAERAMYLKDFVEGHNSFGVNRPALNWHFAEGAAMDADPSRGVRAMRTYFTLLNSNSADSKITIDYSTPQGRLFTKSFILAPRSRANIDLHDPALGVGSYRGDVGASISASLPVIAERSVYIDWPWRLTTNVMGSTAPKKSWSVPEGSTYFFDTYLLILNTSESPTHVNLQMLAGNGEVSNHQFSIAGRARLTVNMASLPGLAEIANSTVPSDVARRQFSLNIQADKEIVVESTMYHLDQNQAWVTGATSLAR